MKQTILESMKKAPFTMIAQGAEKVSRMSAEGLCFWLLHQEAMSEELRNKILKQK